MNTSLVKSTFSSTKTFWLLIGMAILSLILRDLPIANMLFAPFQQFETMLHEMSHALACVFTGGSVSGLTIVEDGNGHGGLTFTRGGIPFIYSQAGYIGETLWGCLLIAISRYPKLSRILLMTIGVSMGIVTLWFMPAGLIVPGAFLQELGSIAWGLAMAGAVFYCGKKLPEKYAHTLLLFIAVQSCLGSLQGIWVLLLQSMGFFPGTWSDATNMENMTHIPAWFWGISWAGFSIGMLSWTMWLTFKAENPELAQSMESGLKKGQEKLKGLSNKGKTAALGSSSATPQLGSSDIEQELLDLQQTVRLDEGEKLKTSNKSSQKKRRQT